MRDFIGHTPANYPKGSSVEEQVREVNIELDRITELLIKMLESKGVNIVEELNKLGGSDA